MSKIEQNKQRKKRAILQAAKESFLSEGYISTSVDVIASRAQITKQTLYRYFPSKQALYEATLNDIAQSNHSEFVDSLLLENTREALLGFAEGFIYFHLSDEHIATYRLLVNESLQAPEMVRSFFEVGPDSTQRALADFFQQRFEQDESKTELWTSMLLAPRNAALLGMGVLTDEQIKRHALEATDLLLAAFSSMDKQNGLKPNQNAC